jgi:hypothetical protein
MQKLQRRRTWWASIFFGASSQEANKDVLAADHALLQEDLNRRTQSMDDGSAIDERFSTNAEEMQLAAGEMELAEGALEEQRSSRDSLSVSAPVLGELKPLEKRCGAHACELIMMVGCTENPLLFSTELKSKGRARARISDLALPRVFLRATKVTHPLLLCRILFVDTYIWIHIYRHGRIDFFFLIGAVV